MTAETPIRPAASPARAAAPRSTAASAATAGARPSPTGCRCRQRRAEDCLCPACLRQAAEPHRDEATSRRAYPNIEWADARPCGARPNTHNAAPANRTPSHHDPEIAQIDVKPGMENDFEAGVKNAAPLFKRAKGCKGMSRNGRTRTPTRYRLFVQWETLENHTIDFREFRRLPGMAQAGRPLLRRAAECRARHRGHARILIRHPEVGTGFRKGRSARMKESDRPHPHHPHRQPAAHARKWWSCCSPRTRTPARAAPNCRPPCAKRWRRGAQAGRMRHRHHQ